MRLDLALMARYAATPGERVRCRPNRRLALALGSLLVAGCARHPPQAILITIDALRADHVTQGLTPALQALARDGVTFSDAVTNSTVTLPSHASMLTGLLPWRHRALENDGRLGPSVVTVASLLQTRRVATAAVVSSFPLHVRKKIRGLERGFDLYDDTFDSQELNRGANSVKTPEETTRLAIKWVRDHRSQAFFLWVHYFPPHGPYTAPSEFVDPAEKPSGETLPLSEVNYEPGAIPKYQRLDLAPDAGLYRSRYAAQVRHVDVQVGRLLKALRRLGVYDDATVVVTSDHGESLGEHNYYFCHGNLVYDEQARIPLLLKLPGRARAGSRMSEPVEAVDIAPTLLEALRIAAPAGLDGQSLLGSLPPSRLRFTTASDAEVVAVREGEHKLTLRLRPPHLLPASHPPRELFLLGSDPGERSNRAADQSAIAERLEREIRHRFGAIPKSQTLDPETAEGLRALGYVR